MRRKSILSFLIMFLIVFLLATGACTGKDKENGQNMSIPETIVLTKEHGIVVVTTVESEEAGWVLGAIEQKLRAVGLEVLPQGSDVYDALLHVDYYTKSHARIIGGWVVKCDLELCDVANNTVLTLSIAGATPDVVDVTKGPLGEAIENFKNHEYFRYLGEIVAAKFGIYDGVQVMIADLEDESAYTRTAADRALRYMEDVAAVDALIAALQDESWWVREAAAESLGKIGDVRAVDALVQLMNEESESGRVRNHAASALGDIGDSRAAKPLNEALARAKEDDDTLFRLAIEEALDKIEAR